MMTIADIPETADMVTAVIEIKMDTEEVLKALLVMVEIVVVVVEIEIATEEELVDHLELIKKNI